MNKVFESIYLWWTRAQLKASPSVQRAVIPRLHEAKEIIRLLSMPHLPVWQLEGQGQGGPLKVCYVGLDFLKPFMIDLMFVDAPVDRRVGRIPFWRCSQVVDLPWGDIIIFETTKHLIRRLPRSNAIVLPELVDHILDVRGDWEEVRSRFRKSVRKNELRLIRKYGYEYDVSRDLHDLEEFYHRMYLPTMDARHGELSSPATKDQARQFMQDGWLLRVKRDGDWVAGVVCTAEQNVFVARLSGVKDGDAQLMHEGATSTTYYAAIHWANQHGYEAVSFMGSGPRLRGGLFQHKRKWGTSVSVSPCLHRQMWIMVRRVTPAVSQFLKETPFVVVDGGGDLHGFVVVDDPGHVSDETKKEWVRDYSTPGLSDLIVRSVDSLVDGSASVDKPDLVIPLTA